MTATTIITIILTLALCWALYDESSGNGGHANRIVFFAIFSLLVAVGVCKTGSAFGALWHAAKALLFAITFQAVSTVSSR